MINLSNGTLQHQTFNCPHCGAPGSVNYGVATYSCLCRFRTLNAKAQYERACGRCGKLVNSNEPITATVVYCSLDCAD